MNYKLPYHIFPLGDSAITVDFGNLIDETINQQVMALFYQFRNKPLPGMIEAVPAYSSITIYYDVMQLRKVIPADKTVYEWMAEQLQDNLQQPLLVNDLSSRLVTIPVCYKNEFAPDTEELAKLKIFLLMMYYEFIHPKLTGFICWGFCRALLIWVK